MPEEKDRRSKRPGTGLGEKEMLSREAGTAIIGIILGRHRMQGLDVDEASPDSKEAKQYVKKENS